MISFSFSLYVEVLDLPRYMQAVQDAVHEAFLGAGRKFLLAAVPRVPIWTGMARGAFRNMEDIFGQVANDNSRTFNKRKGRTSDATKYKAYYYPPEGGRVLRTPEAGRKFATDPNNILDISGVTLVKSGYSFTFRFKVDITYFNYLDDAKWHAFKAGSDAADEYIKNNLVLPDPLKYTKRKLVK